MIKKILCYLLAFTIIVSVAVIPANATSQQSTGRIILSTGFESDDATFNNSALYIDSKGESVSRHINGYMEIKRNTQGTDPYFDVDIPSSVTGGIVVAADFRSNSTGVIADLIKLRYSDNSMVSFASLGADGVIRCGSENLISIDKERMTNIAVLIKSSGEYDIYINGLLKKSGNTGKSIAREFVRCQILPSGANGTLEVDNFKAYAADSYDSDVTSYIVNQDFNSEENFKDGFSRVSAGTGNAISYMEEACLEITTEDTTKDPYIDVLVSDNDTFSSLVFSADFLVEEVGSRTKIFQARNSSKEYLTDIIISENGNVYQQSNMLASFSEGEFINIAVVYSIVDSAYDVYINGEKKVTGAKSGFSGDVERVRLQVLPNYGAGSLKIDNLKVYEGTAPLEIADTDSMSDWSVLPDDTADVIRLSGAVAYHTASNNAFYNGEKHNLTSRPYVKEGELYIPQEITFPITGKEDSGNDVLLSALCKEYQKELFYDETGLVVITDEEFKYANNNEIVKRLSTYLFSVRPDADSIGKLFNSSENSTVHPRILADEADFEYFALQMNTQSYMADWINNIIYRADNIIGTAPCEYYLQGYRLNAVVHEVLERIITLGFAYRVSHNEQYAERAWQEMETVISYPDWNPQHFLDTAELTFAMAIGYDWCYDYLEKIGKTASVENSIIQMGLIEGDMQYRGYATGTSFVFQDMNWNSVCNAGMSIGALAIMEKEPEFACQMLENALRSVEYILPAYAPDGGWQEGIGYWEYATSYLVRMMQALKTVLGTDFGIAEFTGIENTAMYEIAMHGNCGKNNYHDSGDSKELSAELLWLGNYFNRSDITSYYLNEIQNNVQKDEVWRCLYYDRVTTEFAPYNFPNDALFKNLEAVSMRDSYKDKNGMWLSFHAGKNNVNHAHYDAGSFVFDMLGERWASDLGTEGLSYLGTAGSLLYRVRPEGHNTLVINPSADMGQENSADCPITKFVSKNKGAYAITDLTSAYSTEADSVIRGFMLTDDRRTVIIRDEISLKDTSEVYWFMHTMADIDIEDSNTAVLKIGNKSMQLKMQVEGAVAELYETAAEPFEISQGASNQADNSAYSKVAIKATGSGEISISVRLTPLNEQFANNEFLPSAISQWNVEDGEISYVSPTYDREYIIHSELFDEEIDSPPDIWTLWQLNNGTGVIGGMIQSTKTSITRQVGVGGKDDNDGCVVVSTENLTSSAGIDPFVHIECNEAQKRDITYEFQIYAEGNQTVYVQLIDSERNTSSLMELKPDGRLYAPGSVCSAQRSKWHNIAITTHCSKAESDIYLNGRLIASGIPSANNIKRIKLISLYPTPTNGESYSGIMAIDNVRVYLGEKEKYLFSMYQNGKRTDDATLADEVYFKLSNEAGFKAFFVQYTQDGRAERITAIKPGEELKSKILENCTAKLMLWDKYCIIPKTPDMKIGGKTE